MVFASPPPLYLDPPNWQQQPIQHQQEGGGGGSRENNSNHHHNLPLPPPIGGGGSGTGSIRPGSMTDRARLAKIPQPETALKCPRCDSTNTKFCYFNNYSLTQPRHFCKTCRRYWTRGGALRNVPVGGGCRRNKRSSKGSRSKSPAAAAAAASDAAGANSISSSSTSSVLIPATTTGSHDMIGQFPPQHLPNFLTHLNHNLGEYGGSGDLGLSFGGIGTASVGRENNNNNNNNNHNMEFQIGGGFGEHWRVQQGHQFPFLNGLQPPPAGMYPFEAEASEPPQGYSGHNQQQQQQIRSKALDTAMAAVKMEENGHQGLNLSRNFLGISGADQNQYWVGGSGGGGNATNGNGWTDLAGFTNSSSSTRHLL